MLEGLDDQPWETLRHAYGPATDIPDLLRDLLAWEEEVRRAAIGELFATIWHQGSVYEATAPAVPFLIELIENGRADTRADLLHLLARVAAGESYLAMHRELFPAGRVNSPDFIAEMTAELAWVDAARAACEAGLPVFVEQLLEGDPGVAVMSAFLLARFPERAATIAPRLAEQLIERLEAPVKAACILALGGLRSGRFPAEEERTIFNHSAIEQRSLVRLTAALTLAAARVEYGEADTVLAVVRETLRDTWRDFGALPWCEDSPLTEVFERLDGPWQRRVELLASLLDGEEDPELFHEVVAVLEELATDEPAARPDGLRLLARLLGASDEVLRIHAARALCDQGRACAIVREALIRALDQDSEPAVQRHALHALVRIGVEDFVFDCLADWLASEERCEEALEILLDAGPRLQELAPGLILCLDRPLSHNSEVELLQLLGRIPKLLEPALPRLLERLKPAEPQRLLPWVLGRMGAVARPAEARLRELCATSLDSCLDPPRRIHAAMALREIVGDLEPAKRVLAESLERGDPWLRQFAAEAAGELGAEASELIPLLAGDLEGDSRFVRVAAATALWRIGDRRPELPKVLADELDSGPVGLVAIDGLAEMGEAAELAIAALEPLAAADFPLPGEGAWLNEEERTIRAAREALATIRAALRTR